MYLLTIPSRSKIPLTCERKVSSIVEWSYVAAAFGTWSGVVDSVSMASELEACDVEARVLGISRWIVFASIANCLLAGARRAVGRL